MNERARARVGGPLVVACVLLVALLVAIASTWLARRIVRHDVGPDPGAAPAEEATSSELVAPVESVRSSNVQAESAPTEAPAATAETTDDAASTEPVERVLWGYVLDPEGQPVAEGAYLSFTDVRAEQRSARAGQDGAWSMTGLSPGRWFVAAGATGCADAEAVLDLEPGPMRKRHDFTLKRCGRLLVRVVTPEGQGFYDAIEELGENGPSLPLLAVASVQAPREQIPEFHGNAAERCGDSSVLNHGYQVPGAGLGAISRLELFEPLPLHVGLYLFQDLITTQEVDPGSDEVIFVLDPDTALGMLGDLDLTFVAEESGVAAEGVSLTSFGFVGSAPLQLEQGRYTRRDQPPGRYEFLVQAPGREELRFPIDLPPGATIERTIALRAGVSIRGRVVDEAGDPYVSEYSRCPLPEPGEVPQTSGNGWRVAYATQQDGTFDLTSFGPGRWLLQFRSRRGPGAGRASRMSANVVVDNRGGPVTDLVVRVEPAADVVVSWAGPDRERLSLRFLDERDLVRVATRFWSFAPQRVALPPGTWRARVVDESGATVEERGFTLGRDPVVLELGPGR